MAAVTSEHSGAVSVFGYDSLRRALQVEADVLSPSRVFPWVFLLLLSQVFQCHCRGVVVCVYVLQAITWIGVETRLRS